MASQLEKLKRLRRPSVTSRPARCPRWLDLTRAAAVDKPGPGDNLLALAINAAREKATVGEISLALGAGLRPLHRSEIRYHQSGIYRRRSRQHVVGDHEEVRMLVEPPISRSAEGRRPRILVAKMGQDGHDRGQKVIASAFADLGFDVDIGPLFATPAEAARQAVENDVHIVGVSSLAAGHLILVPELKAALTEQGRDDVMIAIGGVIPPGDYEALKQAGASAIFPPGTVIAEAAANLIRELNRRLGYGARAAAE